jgi:hypothetical protein
VSVASGGLSLGSLEVELGLAVSVDEGTWMVVLSVDEGTSIVLLPVDDGTAVPMLLPGGPHLRARPRSPKTESKRAALAVCLRTHGRMLKE